ncbi:hypothetical protein [Paenibacillus pabuli]|uniref:hypothetical protein n=1 Tax=Paenibacillus pabuli TaxID=1472 RepID=UPI003CEF077F
MKKRELMSKESALATLLHLPIKRRVRRGDPAPVDPMMLMDTSKTLTGCDLWNFLTLRKNHDKPINAESGILKRRFVAEQELVFLKKILLQIILI